MSTRSKRRQTMYEPSGAKKRRALTVDELYTDSNGDDSVAYTDTTTPLTTPTASRSTMQSPSSLSSPQTSTSNSTTTTARKSRRKSTTDTTVKDSEDASTGKKQSRKAAAAVAIQPAALQQRWSYEAHGIITRAAVYPTLHPTIQQSLSPSPAQQGNAVIRSTLPSPLTPTQSPQPLPSITTEDDEEEGEAVAKVSIWATLTPSKAVMDTVTSPFRAVASIATPKKITRKTSRRGIAVIFIVICIFIWPFMHVNNATTYSVNSIDAAVKQQMSFLDALEAKIDAAAVKLNQHIQLTNSYRNSYYDSVSRNLGTAVEIDSQLTALHRDLEYISNAATKQSISQSERATAVEVDATNIKSVLSHLVQEVQQIEEKLSL